MGKDNQPKHRQLVRDLKRNAARRAPVDRLLIVCEGEKTEPQYIEEIRVGYRLSTANLQILHSEAGTAPLQIVEYAQKLFLEGDKSKRINPKVFDQIVVVFDRDDHQTYQNALSKVKALDNKHRNDENKQVPFQVIASVPCFELWLLLHFEDVVAPLHRIEVYRRLRSYLPDYDKGQGGHWAATRDRLGVAIERAKLRAEQTGPHDGSQPYTGMHELVQRLIGLRAGF